MLGKLLDRRYQINQILGAGGFGQTYLAEDTRRPGNPTCVVKHLKPASSDPNYLQTARRLFNSEAETLERLGNNDQIPRLLAYFEEDQDFYLVQEYIVGHPLNVELHPGRSWQEYQVINLLQDVLNILAFVHQYGVIHRDLKPDNLIRRDSDGKLVLIDFGAVKEVRTVTAAPGLNSATVAIGTPGYMPREQILGNPQPNSDIYSLGIIAIQALTGLHPTQLPEDPTTREFAWQGQMPVSPGLAAILNKMVRYDYRQRYQSANEVLNALSQLYNTPIEPTILPQIPRQPINQTQALVTPQIIDKPTSNKFPLILGGIMTIVLGAGFAVAYFQSANNPPISEQSPDISPTQTPTAITQKPEPTPIKNNPNPEPTPIKRQVPSNNEFDDVPYPQANCGDSLTTNSEAPIQFYPVFIAFSDNNLRQVTNSFCRDAYKTTREDTNQLAVQVASFTDRNKAELFSDFMFRKLGSGEVGQPTIIEQASSPATPSPTSSPATPSPTSSPTNPLPDNCSLIVNDPQSPLNVRSLPDISSKTVGTLSDKTPVTSIAEKNGWLQISSPIQGWISKSRTRRVCN